MGVKKRVQRNLSKFYQWGQWLNWKLEECNRCSVPSPLLRILQQSPTYNIHHIWHTYQKQISLLQKNGLSRWFFSFLCWITWSLWWWSFSLYGTVDFLLTKTLLCPVTRLLEGDVDFSWLLIFITLNMAMRNPNSFLLVTLLHMCKVASHL